MLFYFLVSTTVYSSEVLLDKVTRIDSADYRVQVSRERTELIEEAERPGDKRTVIRTELLATPIATKAQTSRLIWWTLALDPGSNTVTGAPVYDICSVSLDGKPVLVLGVGNTYYSDMVLILIDAGSVSATSGKPDNRENAIGRKAPSELDKIVVPPDIRGLFGTKSLMLSSKADSVDVSIEKANGDTLAVAYSLVTRQWVKEPAK
jgi:hypothetical protein